MPIDTGNGKEYIRLNEKILPTAALHPVFVEEVAVGDLNSDAKGSGARKNAGKPQLDLIPIRIWRARWKQSINWSRDLDMLFAALQGWQEGRTELLGDWLLSNCPSEYFGEAVKVLEFGAKKYVAWNWAKGMPWSVCVGCILRHTQKILRGEDIDDDSGALHWGHIVCNVIFLVWYADQYPEGDDRPPVYNTGKSQKS